MLPEFRELGIDRSRRGMHPEAVDRDRTPDLTARLGDDASVELRHTDDNSLVARLAPGEALELAHSLAAPSPTETLTAGVGVMLAVVDGTAFVTVRGDRAAALLSRYEASLVALSLAFVAGGARSFHRRFEAALAAPASVPMSWS